MTLKQITILLTLAASSSSLLSMNLAQERVRTWPEEIYHNAYQEAQKYYSFGKNEYERAVACAMTATKEQADEEQWSEEFRVVCDWIYALKKTEEVYLSQPYKPWTIEDLKAISSWLTRLTAEEPGAFRKTRCVYWEIRALTEEERAFASLICQKEDLQRFAAYEDFITATSEESKANWHEILAWASPELQEYVDRCAPDVRGIINQKSIPGYLSEPVSEDEKTFLKAAFIVFPPLENIEPLLSGHLTILNEYMGRLDEIEHGQEQKKVVRQIAAVFHYALVNVHSFAGGSKRLGRLCMNILRMQHGIEPITIADATDYRRSLMISLIRQDQEPTIFVDYIMKIRPSRPSAPEHTQLQPQQETRICAQCNKEAAPKRCGRCKKVNYCDRSCQAQHWKTHKGTCGT